MATYTDPNPNRASLTIHAQSIRPPVVWLVLLGGLLALMGAVFFYGEGMFLSNQLKTVNDSITENQVHLQNLQPVIEELKHDETLSGGMHVLVDNQKEWKGVLSRLEQHLYKKMVVTSLQIDDKGAVTLAGITPTFTDYAKVYSSFSDGDALTYFTQLKPVTITPLEKGGGVSFSLTFTLQPALLNSPAR